MALKDPPKQNPRINPVNLDIGKVPPQAIDLEEAVLGAIMLEKDAVISVLDILRPESFYKEAHQRIYRAIVELSSQQKPIDILTVTEELRARKELEEVGGPFYITQLTSRVASAAHIEYHARIVAQKFALAHHRDKRCGLLRFGFPGLEPYYALIKIHLTPG